MTDTITTDRVTLEELQALRRRMAPGGTVNAAYWLITALIDDMADSTKGMAQSLRFAKDCHKRRLEARER